MALDFTLLTTEQVWGDNALDTIKKYGDAVNPSDLSVLLGNIVYTEGSRTPDDHRICGAWTSSLGRYNDVYQVNYSGSWLSVNPRARGYSARPVLSPEEAQKLGLKNRKTSINGIDVVEYGEYPQTVADEQTSERLEKLFQTASLQQTGKNYTFDSANPHNWEAAFRATTYPEYELEGMKFIRLKARPYDRDSVLSNGSGVEERAFYWVRVEPIEWLKDPTGILISKKALFAGIQFNPQYEYDGDFSKTFMKHYLDTYFAKEIEPSELTADRERKATIKGLSEKLAEVSDLERIKATVKPARTPERTNQLVRITRVRRAKALLSAAAQKAYKEGNKETLQEIVEMAKPYAAREAVVRDKFHQRQAARRAKKGRE